MKLKWPDGYTEGGIELEAKDFCRRHNLIWDDFLNSMVRTGIATGLSWQGVFRIVRDLCRPGAADAGQLFKSLEGHLKRPGQRQAKIPFLSTKPGEIRDRRHFIKPHRVIKQP